MDKQLNGATEGVRRSPESSSGQVRYKGRRGRGGHSEHAARMIHMSNILRELFPGLATHSGKASELSDVSQAVLEADSP